MENLFIIPLGETEIRALLNPMCRRSYMYRLGQEHFRNPDNTLQFVAKHIGLLPYYGYLEHCKFIGIDPQMTEPELSALLLKHGNEERTITPFKAMATRYAELEEKDPTVITEIFA